MAAEEAFAEEAGGAEDPKVLSEAWEEVFSCDVSPEEEETPEIS